MPKLLTTPFATDAPSDLRTDIQVTTGAAPNSATYRMGFPEKTMLSIKDGGMPPKGSDMNGIFYDVTDNLVFLTQGNGFPFDAAYATTIGGYPLNARLRLDNGDIVRSTVANNTTNPNTDMTGWVNFEQDQNTLNNLVKMRGVSAFDYFTKSELAAYNANPTTFDAYRPLQEFLTDITANDRYIASWSGSFYISQGLKIGNAATCKTKLMVGSPIIFALNAIDILMKIEVGVDFVWSGRPRGVGTGGISLASRTCRGIFDLENSADRCDFDGFVVDRANDFGVFFGTKTTVTHFGLITAQDIGSGYSPPNYSLTANYSSITNSGSGSSFAQRSVIAVDVLPPDGKSTDIQIVLGGNHYHIESKDEANGTITVFPWVDTSKPTSGTLYYKWGGAAVFLGGDTSNLNGKMIDGRRCSTVYYMAALYSPVVLGVTAQSCGTAVQVGYKQDGSIVGCQLSGLYTEQNDFDLVMASRVRTGLNFTSNAAFNFNKIDYACAPRTATNTLMPLYANFQSVIFNNAGVVHQFLKQGRNGNEVNTTESIDIFSEPKFKRTFRKSASAQTINLAAPNDPLNQAFGYDAGELVFFGSGTSNEPTGTITFNAPAGFKVNNGASAVFSGFSRAARFEIYYRYVDLDFKVVCYDLKKVPLRTFTWDPPSVPVGGQVSTTTTLTGAAIGDDVGATFSLSTAGLEIRAQVETAGNVTVYLFNGTSAPVDLGSGTVSIWSR